MKQIPEIELIENRDNVVMDAGMILVRAKEFPAITTPQQCQEVADYLKSAKSFVKNTEAACRPRIKQVDDLHKSLLADMNLITQPARTAIKLLGDLMVEYDTRIERERREEHARLERDRIAAEAELRRQDEDRRLAEAAALELAGKQKEAEQLLNRPAPRINVPMPIQEEKQKISGISYRENWKAVMVADDIEDVDPRFVMKVFNQAFADQYAKSLRGGASANGIRFYVEKTAVARV